MPSAGSVFVSYSHKDRKWLEDLRTMLAPDVRDGVVDVWWDGVLKPSQRWREEIQAALAAARVAVLLVSPHFLPFGLLARATLHRLRADRTAAAADLSEALEIADRGGMRLHACDAHLERARLDLQQGDTAAAREQVAAARKLVQETGYKRREREVAWLEGRLGRQ